LGNRRVFCLSNGLQYDPEKIASPIVAICFRDFYVGEKGEKYELFPVFGELFPHSGTIPDKTMLPFWNAPSESWVHRHV
jgi:hypothetical protein